MRSFKSLMRPQAAFGLSHLYITPFALDYINFSLFDDLRNQFLCGFGVTHSAATQKPASAYAPARECAGHYRWPVASGIYIYIILGTNLYCARSDRRISSILGRKLPSEARAPINHSPSRVIMTWNLPRDTLARTFRRT